MTRIKVSGITRPEDALAAAELGVDLVACVFHARSPRFVTIAEAWAIRRVLPSTVALVGVFVDAPLPLVQQIVQQCRLDQVQLFGQEPRSDLDAIRPHAFRALTIEAPDLVPRAIRSELGGRPRRADAPSLLVQLAGPASRAWEPAVAAAAGRAPLILTSTALDAESAAGFLRRAVPWGIDVWDAVESEPGRLDRGRLAELCAAVRSVVPPGDPATAA